MGKNKNPSREPGPSKRPWKITLCFMGLIYLGALILGPTNAGVAGTCEPCKNAAGDGKVFFTVAIGCASFLFAFLFGAKYFSNHSVGHYTCLALPPPINTILFVLWIINFGTYAASFLKAPDRVDNRLKNIMWICVVNAGLWFIIALVSLLDWRRFGRRKGSSPNNVYALSETGNNTGGGHHHNTGGGHYPMPDYM